MYTLVICLYSRTIFLEIQWLLPYTIGRVVSSKLIGIPTKTTDALRTEYENKVTHFRKFDTELRQNGFVPFINSDCSNMYNEFEYGNLPKMGHRFYFDVEEQALGGLIRAYNNNCFLVSKRVTQILK